VMGDADDAACVADAAACVAASAHAAACDDDDAVAAHDAPSAAAHHPSPLQVRIARLASIKHTTNTRMEPKFLRSSRWACVSRDGVVCHVMVWCVRVVVFLV